MNFSQKTYPQMLLIRIIWYTLEQYWQYKNQLNFCVIVKSMISLNKLNTRDGRPIFFINSEILGNPSFGIDTAFTTMSDQPTHNLEILGQPNLHPTYSPPTPLLASTKPPLTLILLSSHPSHTFLLPSTCTLPISLLPPS